MNIPHIKEIAMQNRKRMIFIVLAVVIVCFTAVPAIFAQTSMISQLKSKIISTPRVETKVQTPTNTSAAETKGLIQGTIQGTASGQSSATKSSAGLPAKRPSLSTTSGKYEPYFKQTTNAGGNK